MTPVYGTETLSRLIGREVALKAENLQRTGSFKIRGAVNKIATLSDGERRAGRRRGERRQPRPGGRLGGAGGGRQGDDLHAAGRADGEGRADEELRRAGRARRRDVRGCAGGGARATRRRPARRSSIPYEDERVIAGQGTIGLELAEQVPQAGDGRDPGRRRRPLVGDRARAAGGEARRAHRRRAGRARRADDRGRDRRQAGRRARPAPILDERARRPDHVDDDEICRAIVLLLERTKLVVEGAGAVGVAALLAGKAGGEGPGGRDPLRRQHRPDGADLGHAARADRGRPLPRRAQPPPRPAGRADQAARRWWRRSGRT